MPDGLGAWLPPSGCLFVAGLATVIDLKTYRIPNWLTFGGFVVALFLHGLLSGLEHGVGRALVGALIPFVLFSILGLRGFVGLGDAKLMAAMGAFVQFPFAIFLIGYVVLAGGVLAIGYALARGQLGSVLTSMKSIKSKGDITTKHRIPYALAILIGATWTWVARFYPPVAIF